MKNPAAAEEITAQVSDMVKTMSNRMTEELVSSLKTLIKDKHCSPQQRLFSIRTLCACLKKPNRHLCDYVPSKLFSRLGILARHRKVGDLVG
jgi:hypothetical protein